MTEPSITPRPPTDWVGGSISWSVTMMVAQFCSFEQCSVRDVVGCCGAVMVLRGSFTIGKWIEMYLRLCTLYFLPQGDLSAVMLVGSLDHVREQAVLGVAGIFCLATTGLSAVYGCVVLLILLLFNSTPVARFATDSKAASLVLFLGVQAGLCYMDRAPLPPVVPMVFLAFVCLILPTPCPAPTSPLEPVFGHLLTKFFLGTLPTVASLTAGVILCAAAVLQLLDQGDRRERQDYGSDDVPLPSAIRVKYKPSERVVVTLGDE
eukprot:TRINITY_DN31891_c0_g1_i1.p1 TRINITY_DN31891_c0_g1~~TRINITY_DN31891_c0_g1_i1.p1  ORF type:complete len:263 (+),score=41.68 TRINITY_DN31891_c0_g1_i1:56-844(+)